MKVDLANLAVGNVFQCVEITIVGRNLNSAPPTHCSEIVFAVGIRNVGTIDDQLIVVEAFVKRS